MVCNQYFRRKWGKLIFPLVSDRIADTQRKLEDPTYEFEEPVSLQVSDVGSYLIPVLVLRAIFFNGKSIFL